MIKESIGEPEYKDTLENADALNKDIISSIHKNIPRAIEEVKDISKKFLKGYSKEETCRNIWDFLKNEIHYKKDSVFDQKVKLPKRFLKDSEGDCKSYSLFTYAVLKALGDKNVRLRYAGYGLYAIPSHVYCVTKDERGKLIIIDAVWHTFNSEKKYQFKKDYKMRVHTLSGTDSEDIGSLKDKFKKLGGTIKTAATSVKGAIKQVANQIKTGGLVGGVKTIYLAPGRASFLALVGLNFRGFATRIAKAFDMGDITISDRWKKFGGDPDQLKRIANQNKNKPAILGSPKISGIGEPVTATAAIAAAAPIIVAIIPLLAKLKLGDKSDAQTASEASEEFKQESGGEVTASQVATAASNNPATVSTGFSVNPVLLLAAGAIIFLGLKKK